MTNSAPSPAQSAFVLGGDCVGAPDLCGAPAGVPCEPGCPSLASDDLDVLPGLWAPAPADASFACGCGNVWWFDGFLPLAADPSLAVCGACGAVVALALVPVEPPF